MYQARSISTALINLKLPNQVYQASIGITDNVLVNSKSVQTVTRRCYRRFLSGVADPRGINSNKAGPLKSGSACCGLSTGLSGFYKLHQVHAIAFHFLFHDKTH